MKLESNRIFISDLPETATKEQIENAFGNYGEITSVEIKERKELGQKNSSLFFAYVTINIDAKNLNQCFNDFSQGKWLGQYIMLQIARESFLDRLKRERENNPKPNIIAKTEPDKKCVPEKKLNGLKKVDSVKTVSSDSDSTSDSEKDEEKCKIENKSLDSQVEEPILDLIIKNNRGKTQKSKSLKIDSVGKEPIIKIEQGKKKATINMSADNLKRLESLKLLKQGYQNRKSLIKAALSNVDSTPKNKIVFDDHSKSFDGIEKTSLKIDKPGGKNNKNILFSESDSEDFEGNFSVKEHFEGKEGQKLLELQSKYKNDKRFILDKRFLDNESAKNYIEPDRQDNEEISLEEEKKKEYAILEQVLGKKIVRKADNQTTSNKSMIRFDPSQPEHSKYQIAKPPEKKEKKRKRKNSNSEITEEKKADEKAAPEVSKEIFYKVADNLKQTFEEPKEFSLLSMFGQHEAKDEDTKTETQVSTSLNSKFQQEKNPFKYDSSDDEDETEDIPSKSDEIENGAMNKIRKGQNTTRNTTSWTDPFFFKEDDYRLQEGFDFFEKMKLEDKTEFTKLRRDLKGIVKAKVRNNLRKNKPFKKKLGGSRKKKVLRLKKAMNR